MLEIKALSKKYGEKLIAVNEVSMHLQRGVIGLIGHNGAGKTSLMQMLATLSRPTQGEIIFQGVDIVKHPDAMRTRLGYLPQDFGVYPNLSALEFLQYFAALKGVRDSSQIETLLELVNLTEHAHRIAATFSGGMRRRLGIAQALLGEPDILIVDEPTAGLDPEERIRFRNLLADFGAEKLVLISTHIVSDVESIADQLAVMRQGRLLSIDTPEAMIARAHGQIWSAKMSASELDLLRSQVQILQTQKQGEWLQVKMAHGCSPCAQAELLQPTLEDALMAQRYAVAGEVC